MISASCVIRHRGDFPDFLAALTTSLTISLSSAPTLGPLDGTERAAGISEGYRINATRHMIDIQLGLIVKGERDLHSDSLSV